MGSRHGSTEQAIAELQSHKFSTIRSVTRQLRTKHKICKKRKFFQFNKV